MNAWKRKGKLTLWFVAICLLLAACSSASNPPSSTGDPTPGTQESGSAPTGDTEAVYGGEAKVAISAQPATLDPHMTTAGVTNEVSRNIFEQLLVLNDDYQPTPMLAESVDTSEDGMEYTFHLRKGILFHNGEEMLAEDVIASLKKWMAANTKAFMFEGAELAAEDDYTVTLTMKTKVFGVLEAIADNGQFSGIMPKEIAESAPPEGISEYIGTGPFKFEEWVQDQYIHLVKHEDYVASDKPTNGLAGKKEAFLDGIYYYFVGDSSTRLAGLQTGEYHIAADLPIDNYEQIKSMPDVSIGTDYGNLVMIYNKKQGIFTNGAMRKAVNAALDHEAIMIATQSFPEFYRLNSSYMYKEQADWYTEAGSEHYNQHDIEKSKAYLEEAGYNGEAIRILSTRDYDWVYNSSVVIKEQLEQAGMKVELLIFDWPTLLDMRSKPDDWDIVFTGFPIVLSPTQILYLSPTWPGWTDDPTINSYIDKINLSTSTEEAVAIWNELQAYAWEYLPVTKIGDRLAYTAYTNKLQGYRRLEGNVLWNTSLIE